MSICKQKTQYRSFLHHILLFELSQTLVHNPVLPLLLWWWYGCIMLYKLQLCCCLLLPHRLHKLEDVGVTFTHKFCELQGGRSCSPPYFIKTPASLVVSVDLHLMSYLVHPVLVAIWPSPPTPEPVASVLLAQYAYTGACSLYTFGPVRLHRSL